MHAFSAVIALTALDGLFVIISISWDFLQDPSCVCTDTCQETPHILEVFEVVSLVITSLFLLEIPLSLYSIGLSHYTTAEHAYLHAFDAAVIITTFALEVFLRVNRARYRHLFPSRHSPLTACSPSLLFPRAATPRLPTCLFSLVCGASPSSFRPSPSGPPRSTTSRGACLAGRLTYLPRRERRPCSRLSRRGGGRRRQHW